MQADTSKARVWEFGPFRLDESERLLLRDGAPVPLTPKVFDTLVALVERSGHLIDKEELVEKLWPDTFVEVGTLTRNVSDLRKALGEENYVETVPKRGYRFVAPVTEIDDGCGAAVVLEVTTGANPLVDPEGDAAREGAQFARSLGAPAVDRLRGTPGAIRWRPAPAFWAGVSLVAGMAVVLWISRQAPTRQPASGSPIRSIAILPFKPLTPEGGDQYLGVGITDTLITRLSNIGQVIVRPTSAVQKYATGTFDPVAVGREQRVDAVLEGSVQKLGDRVRVTVRLLGTKDGAPLWAYQCDQYCDDLFAVQDTISEQVATALLAKLTGEEKRLLGKRETGSAEAYQLYLKGRHFWNRRNAEGLKKSIEYFEQAIARDPNYARAFAGLSDSYLLLWGYGFMPPDETIPRVKATAKKALELDATLAEAHLSLGAVAWNYDWDWKGAEREFRRAIELNPNYATAHHYLGEFLAYQERFDEGWAEIGRALELDPTSLIINCDAGLILQFWRRWDDAIEQYRKTLEMDPSFRKARRFLAGVYTHEKEFEAAKAELEKLRQIDDSPGKWDWLMATGDLYVYSGRRAEAQRAYAEMKRLAARGYLDPGILMWMHIHLGEKDQAFEWMEKAYAARSTTLTSIRVNPGYDPLRSDPRFKAIRRRMNFPQ